VTILAVVITIWIGRIAKRAEGILVEENILHQKLQRKGNF